MHRDLAVAIRHFPDRANAINDFASRNEDFYTLCVDLADAEREVTKWQTSTGELAEKRCAEYVVLVKELAEEIELLLNSMAIVPFGVQMQKPSR